MNRVYSYGTGGPTSVSQDKLLLEHFEERFAKEGYKLPELLRDIALSDAFSGSTRGEGAKPAPATKTANSGGKPAPTGLRSTHDEEESQRARYAHEPPPRCCAEC